MSTVKHQIWLITLAQNPFFEWAKKLNYVRIKFKSPKSSKSQPFIFFSKIIAQNSLFWYFRAGNFRIFNWNELGTFWKFWKFYIPIENYAQKIHQFSLNSSRNLNFKIALDFSSPRNNFQRSNIILNKTRWSFGIKVDAVFFGPSSSVFLTIHFWSNDRLLWPKTSQLAETNIVLNRPFLSSWRKACRPVSRSRPLQGPSSIIFKMTLTGY